MSTSAQTPEDRLTFRADGVADLPAAVFVERWRLITGEPPSVLLSSRMAMLALLVESTPVAPLEPPIPTWDGCTPGAGTAR
ncbi:hypothetical protein MKL09_09695 [Methylobacterium sp. J-048]|uniref:hypothetical protein n=1 Tax=Methylobacterium sp. J-048 TaxID=2836635 RepID=UPI001FBBAFD2|nr:hypothetical protein [Methylobacterium sp. J-048]MCJ2056826.1 hypothetical protein [Methylobacterium sp. J-048]